MAVEPVTSFSKLIGSRKVCVLNMDERPYEEEFKGENIVVPPLGKRELYMPLWKARGFLSSCAYPPATTYTGEPIKGGRVKMLRISELTKEERKALGELSPDEVEEEAAKSDEKLRNSCMICGTTFKNEKGLKLHNTRVHPDGADNG